jgi:glycine oxidase
MSMDRSFDVAVVGGGIVGLSIAWRAAERGLSVVLLEREAIGGGGASRVAAGMLAPVSEVEYGPGGRRVLELGLRSARMWPRFASELEAAGGRPVGLSASGTLMLARDEDEARELERKLAFRESLGLRAVRLRPSAARAREPALAPTVRLALWAPDDHSVDPRLALAALRGACESAGVRLREHTAVTGLDADEAGGGDRGGGGDHGAGRVRGVVLRGGERVRAAQIVIAAGAWSGQVEGVPERVPVRPVKGQTLRLRDPEGPGLLRGAVRFEGGYLVPRAEGRYVLGATVEERGFEQAPTAGAIYELLRDAHELVPGVSELEIEELCVGLRPGTPDNAPAIGPGALAGLVWACGHYRNGILLAPLTAELVAGVLAGEPADPLLSACAPARFAPSPPAGPATSGRVTHGRAEPLAARAPEVVR